jgi:hypothetical protein
VGDSPELAIPRATTTPASLLRESSGVGRLEAAAVYLPAEGGKPVLL